MSKAGLTPGPALSASLGHPFHLEPSSVFTFPVPSFPNSLDQISHLAPEDSKSICSLIAQLSEGTDSIFGKGLVPLTSWHGDGVNIP